MIFHKVLFGLFLLAVFAKGATDAGREDLLNQLLARTFLSMSVEQLSDTLIRG